MIQRKKKTGKLMRMLLTLAAVWMLMECMTAFAQESDGQLPNGKSVYNLLLSVRITEIRAGTEILM